MSERFVSAWKASPEKLLSLVGKQKLDVRKVIADRANAACREDVSMSIADGDDEDDEEGGDFSRTPR